MRADDFVAESLETEANRMPPGSKDQADLLRLHAKRLRESGATKLISVKEVTSYT
jgi:hypothetical protein